MFRVSAFHYYNLWAVAAWLSNRGRKMSFWGPTFRGGTTVPMKPVLHVETSFPDCSATIFRFFFSISNEQYMNDIYRKGSSIQWVLAAALNTLMILWDINNKKLRAPSAVLRLISRFMLFCIPTYLLVKGQLLCLQITGVFQLLMIGTHKQQILGAQLEISRCRGGPRRHCLWVPAFLLSRTTCSFWKEIECFCGIWFYRI